VNRSIESMGRALFVVCFLLATWHFFRVVTAPLLLIVQYLPDDAFYYLGISRNLGLLGKSSFDGGQTLTTGYHPLWAWACQFLGWTGGYQPMRMLREMIVLSGVLSLGVAAVAGRLAWGKATTTLPIIALLLTSFSFLNSSISAMEWCLVIVISAATLWLMLGVPTRRVDLTLAGLASLGVLGSLARSDFGGQAAGYLAAAIFLWLLRRDRRYLLPSLVLALGACFGLGLATWRDYNISGEWLQSSAHMKQLWGKSWGTSPLPFFWVLLRTLVYLPSQHKSIVNDLAHSSRGHALVLFLLLAGLAALVYIFWRFGPSALRKARAEVNPCDLFLGVSGSLILLLYTAVYSLNSLAMQAWYSAEVTVALGVLLSLLMAKARQARMVTTACATVSILAIANMAIYTLSNPIYSNQKDYISKAEGAKQAFGDASIGVADAGIFNFVYGGRIVNLDGLVNDEIVRYAPDRLPCYLADKHIQYASGFGHSSTVAFKLQPLTNYATPVRVPLGAGEDAVFFHIDPDRVRALPECARSRPGPVGP